MMLYIKILEDNINLTIKIMEKDSKKRLFEVMSRLDKTFKPPLNEWNFDKKKGEGKDEEEKETKKHEESDITELDTNSVDMDESGGHAAFTEQPVTEKFNKWGKAQDDWASIENGPANRGKDLQKKANLAKKSSPEVGSGNGSSHVPEYYDSYDSETPIANTNNLTQRQIDAMNDKWRNSMQQDVRRSMNRGDGGWSMDENKE